MYNVCLIFFFFTVVRCLTQNVTMNIISWSDVNWWHGMSLPYYLRASAWALLQGKRNWWTAIMIHKIIIVCFLYFAVRVNSASTTANKDPRCYRSINDTGPCMPMTSNLCIGVALPFSQTSLILANDSRTLSEALEKLSWWSGLKKAPQCWAVIQPFLCSVYLPR